MAEDNLTNIINNLKGMLKTDDNTNHTESPDSSNNSNLNITPEMIKNLASMLQTNNSHSENTSNTENSGPSTENTNTNNSSNNIDFETILKIKSIMETFNKKDDPRSNLLYSLKPYLRESRQKKIDQYVNLFKITQVTNLFKNEKGDEN